MPLQRETIWVHCSRVYLARYVPPSGFFNLLAVSSSNRPETFFHASGTHGVFPCRAFPLKTALDSHRAKFPHRRRTVLHPQPPACLHMNSCLTPTRRKVRNNKYATYVVLICSQVRSHPTLVLPFAGGRYSLGFVNAFEGISIYWSRFKESSSHVLKCSRKRKFSVLQSIKNQLTGVSSQRFKLKWLDQVR